MSATCPACGVAVVPGYVRCPKCQNPLPANRRTSTVAGGTAVSGGGFPLLPVIGGAVVILGLILYFALGKSSAAKPKLVEVDAGIEQPDEDNDQVAPTPQPPDTGERDQNRIDPNAIARDFERALKNQRLWSNVEVVGNMVEVHSGSCRDANMVPMVDAARIALRSAGLTRLRCIANSGVVVFERDL